MASNTKLTIITFYVIYLFIYLFWKFDLNMAKYTQRLPTEYPPELWWVPSLIESTASRCLLFYIIAVWLKICVYIFFQKGLEHWVENIVIPVSSRYLKDPF